MIKDVAESEKESTASPRRLKLPVISATMSSNTPIPVMIATEMMDIRPPSA
jgi:hypothetical protein